MDNEKRLQSISIIVKHFGAYRQRFKAIEELTELTEAIIKDLNKIDYDKKNVLEEMADVMIMLKQLQQIYGFSDEKIMGMVDDKLGRTMRRVRHETNLDRLISDYNNGKCTDSRSATATMGDDR